VRAWPRRAAAAAFALALVALVVCDSTVGAVRSWGDGHALTASVVANVVVLGVAGLVVDEVVARRQRKDRSVSVAVQSLIVFDQTRRAADAVVAEHQAGPGAPGQAHEELRGLTSMLLTASPNLFDDPQARSFLDEVQRATGAMVRLVSPAAAPGADGERLEALTRAMADVRDAMAPLAQRLSGVEVNAFLDRVPGSDGA